ncbi:MAG: hypothetical protein ACTHOF_07650 [Flavisolibacter sp.]
MKKIFIFSLLQLVFFSVFGQAGDTINKKVIAQLGYVSEYVDGGGSGLNGIEAQFKYLFGKHLLAKKGTLGEALYVHTGFTVFTGAYYSLNQLTGGIGFTSPFLISFLHMDLGLQTAYYSGKLGEETWTGKKLDFGWYFGFFVPFGRNGAAYIKYTTPGGISGLSESNDYIAPMFIAGGIQF